MNVVLTGLITSIQTELKQLTDKGFQRFEIAFLTCIVVGKLCLVEGRLKETRESVASLLVRK
jgi:hypothetical protein